MSYNIYPWYADNSEIPTHCHTRYVNSTIEWAGSDTSELYHKNLQNTDTYNMLQRFGWMEPIAYTFNNHGFRAEAFDDRPAGLALGCSFTDGVGIRVEQTWPRALSKMLNTHIWNLGIPGAALDTVFRILDYYLTKFNPKFVCILMPTSGRLEYCDIYGRYPIIQVNTLTKQEHFAKEWLAQSINGITNRRKNMLAIKQLCYEAKVPLFFEDSDGGYNLEDIDYARDLLHYGPKVQQHIANQFYNQMKEHHGI